MFITKRRVSRICITISLTVFLIFSSASTYAQERTPVIIDSDTGNEVDDLYAIIRGLIEPDWEVVGLNATQWQASHWAVDNSMENSYRLNNVLLSYTKMNNSVASNRGAEARLYDWGNKSQTSAASQFIINQARNTKDGKITVIALGALTNVASALLDDPSVIDDIRLYWLGSSFDFDERVMKNTDFNSVMDIQALDVVLNSDVELHIIPNNVASQMTFRYEETEKRFKGKHDVLDFLLQRWFNHLDGGRRQRTIWDLSLIEAIIHPEYSEQKQFTTPKGKGNRQVWFYTDIDADKMRRDFYTKTLNYVENLE